MKYVLDSSTAFKWVVLEAQSDIAQRLRDNFRKGNLQLFAPDIFPVEVGHALTRAERQGRISSADGWALWQSVMIDAPQLFPSIPLMPRAYALSSTLRVGIYDCLYLALAEQEGCSLITADNRLARTVTGYSSLVTPLAGLP